MRTPKVQSMNSPKTGSPVANQFVITTSTPTSVTRVFQSYNSAIAKIDSYLNDGRTVITLDEYYWDYSRTTSKYRNEFLRETTKETQAKIKSGEYKLANLN